MLKQVQHDGYPALIQYTDDKRKNNMSQSILDSREQIAELDQENMLGSVEALAHQVTHAWHDTQQLTWQAGKEIRNVVVSGMGGSGLGADVIKNLFKSELKVPFEFVHDYTLPGYVNENTLVILSSYSGNTEETLSGAELVIERKAQVMVISAGGKLADLAKQQNWTLYQIDPQFNPCNQPRMAIGYAVMGTIGLASKASLISLTQAEIDQVVSTIAEVVAANTVEIAVDQNQAKQLAFEMVDRKTLLVGAEFLTGAIHTAANQANENAKAWTDYAIIPEINHHLMEGLKFTGGLQHTGLVIFLQSKLYHPQNQKRVALTQEIFEEAGMQTQLISLKSPTPLTQVFEAITLLGFANFYLSMLHGINPSPIPIVESFKKRMV